MLYFLSRGRYGHFYRIAVGVALLAMGLALASKLVALLGAVLIVWGLAATAGLVRASVLPGSRRGTAGGGSGR